MAAPTSTPTEPHRGDHALRRRRLTRFLILAGIAVVAVNLVIFGLSQARTGTESQTGTLPSEVQSIGPVPGSTIRPQDTVNVDLRDGLVGDLVIDGAVIPVDQTEQIAALGIISFRPGPGKEITAFTPGRHTAEVRWRNLRAPVDVVDGTYSWTFGVA